MIALDPKPYPIDHIALRGAAEAVALIDKAGTMTFAEVEAGVAALAGWLAGQGLAAGDRVATWLPKTRVACLMPLAVARAGMVHVPVNPLLRRAQVAHILGDSGARVLVTQGVRAGTLDDGDVPEGCAIIEEADLPLVPRRTPGSSWDDVDGVAQRAVTLVLPTGVPPTGVPPTGVLPTGVLPTGVLPTEVLPTGPRPSPGNRERGTMGPSDADTDSLAAILYTSGSTGRPKGVMLSHANLWLGAISVAHYLKLEPEDRVLGVLPLSFDYGQNQLFSTWAAGASVAPLDYLVARDVVKAVERVEATTLAGVPPLWVQLLEAEWPVEAAARLKRLTNSGGALTPRLVRGLRERFPAADVYAMYGLTEAFRSTYLDPALIDLHPDAMGRAIPFAEVSVVKPDGTRAAPGEAGELVHAGPLVAQGYWQDAERTAQRFRPAPDGVGMAVWSGDTVVEGEDGLLRFVGRDDEMIKSAGNRISPLEVEEAVLAGGEASEAVAVGVPDERLGQAIVVMLAGDASDEAALRARLRMALPSFMQPGMYFWRDELPRNANGKLDRSAIALEVKACSSAKAEVQSGPPPSGPLQSITLKGGPSRGNKEGSAS